MAEMKVSEIIYYPIKSCGGISVANAPLDSRGIEHDREFMIVDAENRYVNQKKQPRLALIQPRIYDRLLEIQAKQSGIIIPIMKEGPSLEVRLRKEGLKAVDQGEIAAGWLSEFLGGNYRLVRMADDFVRKVESAYARREYDQVAFSDEHPFLIISEESLADLNSRLGEKAIPMNRFRPNIVISGSGIPYMEDDIKRIKIGNVAYDVVKPCARCDMIQINQDDAKSYEGVLPELAKYRLAMVDGKRKALFGQYVIHERPGSVKVGDKVEIEAFKPEEEKIKFLAKVA